MGAAPDPSIVRLGKAMLARVDEVAAAMADVIRRDVGFYQSNPGVVTRDELRRSCAANMTYVYEALAGDVDADVSVAEAARSLRDAGIGALVVSNDGSHIDGVVSERDIVRALANHGASVLGRTVSSVMSTDIVTCAAGDGVESLMRSMTERRIRHLPVTDADGVLGGMISIGDVVKSRLGELESENQHLVDYIHGR